MKLKDIRETVLSTAVGDNVLHNGSILPMIRRPNLLLFNKKKKKRKKNEKRRLQQRA